MSAGEPFPGSRSGLDDVAVLIGVYNNPDGLARSLRSVAAAGAAHVVVVDDGSEPPVPTGLLGGSEAVVLLRSPSNVGIAAALNLGLDHILSRGAFRYVARLDAGDTVHPTRLAKQRARLEAAARLGIIGSWVKFSDPQDAARVILYQPPTSPGGIRRAMPIRNALIHPAVMIRLEVFEAGAWYSTQYPACEDYELFWRIVSRYDAENLPEVLTDCEWNSRGISMSKRRRQLVSKFRLQMDYFSWSTAALAGLAVTVGGLLLPYPLVTLVRRAGLLRGLSFAR